VTTDHREEPGAEWSTCQKVFKGFERSPMGSTAHEPLPVSMELDSGTPAGAAADADGTQTERPARQAKRHAATVDGAARRDGLGLTN
jgi:hypothetical protein